METGDYDSTPPKDLVLLPLVRRKDGQKTPAKRLSPLWIPQTPRLSSVITRAIFHSYLSVTHCPLIHQQASKRKHLLWVFILCLWRLASHISHKSSVWDGGKGVNITLKQILSTKKREKKDTIYHRNKKSTSKHSPSPTKHEKTCCGLMHVWQTRVRQLCI